MVIKDARDVSVPGSATKETEEAMAGAHHAMTVQAATLVLLLVAAFACTRGATAAPSPPNLEATAEAAKPAMPSPSAAADVPDVEALVAAQVESTVEALRPATPVPPEALPSLAPTSPNPTPTIENVTLPTPTPIPAQQYLSQMSDLALDVAAGWSVTDDYSTIVIFGSDEGDADFRVYESESGDNLEDVADSLIGRWVSESPDVFDLISRSTITLDSGLPAVRLEYRWRRSPVICIERRIRTLVMTDVGPYTLAGKVCESQFDLYADDLEAMAASFRPVPPPLTDEQAVGALQEFLGSRASTIWDPDVRALYWRLATEERELFVTLREGYSWRILGPGLALSDGALTLAGYVWWEVRADGEELYVGPSDVEGYEDDGAAALLLHEMDSPGPESYRLAEVFRWDEVTCEILAEDKRITEDLVSAIDESDAMDTAPWEESRARLQALKTHLDAAEIPSDARLMRDKLQEYLITETAALDYRLTFLSTGDQNSQIEGVRLHGEATLAEEQAKELLDDLRVKFRLDVLHELGDDEVAWTGCFSHLAPAEAETSASLGVMPP